MGPVITGSFEKRAPGALFSKASGTFRARKAMAKSRTLKSCFTRIFLIWAEVPFIQEAGSSPFLDTDELKMALPVRKVSGAFEKRAPGPGCSKDGYR